MRHYLTIGVAGHVDHGKTTLVRHLTGIDTDRNPEEKRRGLSIESGVAAWSVFADVGIALVDVPGHVDFLKNAIRGLHRVDLALLVVAADDGVMPQTREHLDILRYFGTRGGLVILSKTDLVDRETIEIAKLELEDLLQGTFLAGKPILPFSVRHPPDTEIITRALREEIAALPRNPRPGPFRLWIDQVRQLTGIGTVVSGTVTRGCVHEGAELEILPSGIPTRIRTMKCHGGRVNSAVRGQRVGINLPKIPLSAIARGMVLAAPGSIPGSRLYNAVLRMRSGSQGGLKNGQRVKLYVGTGVLQTTVFLMGRTHLPAGQSGLVQLRLTAPLNAAVGDAFVIALLNRNQVLGGGVLLERTRQKYRPARHDAIVPFLKALEARDIPACVDIYMDRCPHRLLTAQTLADASGMALDPLEAAINARVHQGDLIYIKGRGAIRRDHYNRHRNAILAKITSISRQDPFHRGLASAAIKDGLDREMDPRLLGSLLGDLVRSGKLEESGGRYRLTTPLAVPDTHRTQLLDHVRAAAEGIGLCPFSEATLAKACTVKLAKSELQKVLSYLVREKKMIRLNNGRFLTPAALETIKVRIRHRILQTGCLRLADCKALLGYGRMGAVPVLEYLDQIGFTVRQDNARVLREKTGGEPAIL